MVRQLYNSLRCLFLILMLCIPLSGRGYDFVAGDIAYNVTGSNTVEVAGKGAGGYSGKLTLPAKITSGGKTYSVTAIGKSAFKGCGSLNSVTLPEGVTVLGDSAFYDCYTLAPPVLPSTLVTIGNFVFYSCYKLTSITLPAKVKTIGENAFKSCTQLVTVTLSEGLTTLGSGAFSWCSRLVAITLPESLETLQNNAFYGCTGLTSIRIPAKVANLEKNTFYGCNKLTSVVLSEGIKAIREAAFSGCSSLSSVTIPESLTIIDLNAFNGCSGLAFVKVRSATPPLASSNAGFDTKKAVLYVPKGAHSNYAFHDVWGKFEKIQEYDPSLVQFETGGISYAEVTKTTVQVEARLPAYTGELSIPEKVVYEGVTYAVTGIGDNAFANCTGLTSVSIPESVTSLGMWAFKGCSSLTSVALPEGITAIGASTFSGCVALTSAGLPATVTSIGERAFENCKSLTSLLLPDGLKVIGEYAFTNCSQLAEASLPAALDSLGISAFSFCSALAFALVPEGVKYIAEYAFYNCKGLQTLVLPKGLKGIGEYAFTFCAELKSVLVPDGVTRIGSNSFYGCSALATAVLPAGLESIEKDLFYNCSALTSLVIPEGVTRIGNNAFYNCSALTYIVFPEKLESLGYSVFYGCTGLAYVKVASSVPFSINTNTFPAPHETILYVPSGSREAYGKDKYWGQFQFILEYDPTVMQFESGGVMYAVISANEAEVTHRFPMYEGAVFIPDQVNHGETTYQVVRIGDNAFYTCSGLTGVTLSPNVVRIGKQAFLDCTGLLSVKVLSPDPPAMDTDAFEVYEQAVLYVPSEGYTAYTHDKSWGQFRQILKYDPAAVHFETAGMSYTVTGAGEVEVTSLAKGYEGTVLIPEKVVYEGNLYRVTAIGGYAFYRCTGLTSARMPESVATIGRNAFSGCSGMLSVSIPESTAMIEDYAFSDCAKLMSVRVSSALPASVADHAFSSYNMVLYVPSGLSGTYSKDKIWGQFKSVIPYSFVTGFKVDGIEYTELNDNEVKVIRNKSADYQGTLSVPESITYKTKKYAVTSLEDFVFLGFPGLTSVTLPTGVKSLPAYALGNCTALVSVRLPEGLERIGTAAFYNCASLPTLKIPAGVTEIGAYAFEACNALSSLKVLSSVPPSVPGNAFSRYDLPLHVPLGSYAIYSAHPVWGKFAEILEFDPDQPDGLAEVSGESGHELTVLSEGEGTLNIHAARELRIALYHVSGIACRTLHLQEGGNVLTGLSPGIYLLAGQKVIVH